MPLPTAESMDVQPVPESLALNPTLFHAQPVCGSAGGRLTHLKSLDLRDSGRRLQGAIEQEQAALGQGLTLLVKNIEFRLLDNDGTASAILRRIALGHRPRCASICWAGC